MSEEKTRDQGRYLVRFPEGMRERLAAEAEFNKRSMNAEIVARLEFTLELPERRRKEAEQVEVHILRQDYELQISRLAMMQEQVMRAAESVENLAQRLADKGVKIKP